MITTFQEQSPQSLPAGAARHIGHKIRELLSAQAGVNVAMPGGRSMAALFGFLIQEEVEWPRVHFFSLDERLVPLDHPDSNYKLLHDHLLAPLDRAGKINRANAHPFVFDPAVADLGTRAYERVLAGHGSRFDLIVLSAGEDGHVGALFPGHHSVVNPHHGFIVMHDAPKPPPGRMSASRSLLQTASAGVLLFAGEAKRQAWRQFGAGTGSVVECPARLMAGIGDAAVFTDLL